MAAFFEPVLVVPSVIVEIGDDRSRFRTGFLLESVGVGFFVDVTVLVFDFVFVVSADREFGNEEFPDSSGAATHLVLSSVPLVEVAEDRDVTGVRSPDSEVDSRDTVLGGEVSAEFFVDAVMVAFGEEMKVKFGQEGRAEGVRIVDDAVVFAKFETELVIGEFGRVDRAFKEVGVMQRLHRIFCARFWQDDGNRIGVRLISSDDPDIFSVLLDWMGTKHLKWIMMLVPNNALYLVWGDRH